MNIETQIRQFITSELLFSQDSFPYSDETSLLGEGILDSLGVMQLVEFVQKSFEVTLAEQEVMPENFDSVSRLAAFIRRKQKVSLENAHGVH